MRASIDRRGRLAIMPENECEEYAAACWFENACKVDEERMTTGVVLSVEMKGLQLGPQPCLLIAVAKKEEGEEGGD